MLIWATGSNSPYPTPVPSSSSLHHRKTSLDWILKVPLSCLFLLRDSMLHESMCYFLNNKILQRYLVYLHTHHPALASCCYLLYIFKNMWQIPLKHFVYPPYPTRGNFCPKVGIYHFHASLHTFATHICMHKYYRVSCFPTLKCHNIVRSFT